jgi:hypothetical protein
MYKSAKGIIKFGDKFLVGEQIRSLNLLGGRRNYNEKESYDTFTREFNEETSCVLSIQDIGGYLTLVTNSGIVENIYLKFLRKGYDPEYKIFYYIFEAEEEVKNIKNIINIWNKEMKKNQLIIIEEIIKSIKEKFDIIDIDLYDLIYEYILNKNYKILNRYDPKIKEIIIENGVYLEMRRLRLVNIKEMENNLLEKSILKFL